MNWRHHCIPLCSVALLMMSSLSCSHPSAMAADEKDQQDSFAKDYIAAKQSKDSAKLVKLLHPKVRACMNDQNREYFDRLLTQDMRRFPAGNPTKISIAPVAPNAEPMIWGFMPREMFPYPVMPTHTIQADLQSSTASSISSFTAFIEIAPYHGSWYWVTACPTDKGMEFIRAKLQEGERQKAKARELASELKEPLLSQIKSLLRAHDRIGAIKKYQAATGADLTTASTVMDALEYPER